jgi:hypothetical protein
MQADEQETLQLRRMDEAALSGTSSRKPFSVLNPVTFSGRHVLFLYGDPTKPLAFVKATWPMTMRSSSRGLRRAQARMSAKRRIAAGEEVGGEPKRAGGRTRGFGECAGATTRPICRQLLHAPGRVRNAAIGPPNARAAIRGISDERDVIDLGCGNDLD